jgi:AcrR family transcriptional regulator
LNRERAVRAAVALADDEGIDAVSMRNLASRLGVVPMALYRHVVNKEDLLNGMVEAVYDEVDVPSGVGWLATMRQRATSMRAALQRHPWAVGLMETSSPGPANLHYHNAGIACLREQAGLPVRAAIDAYNLMDSYIYGFALQEKTLPSDIAAAAEARRQDLTTADPSLASRFPYLIEVVEELGASGYDYTGQFERGLELILDGIEQLRHDGQRG